MKSVLAAAAIGGLLASAAPTPADQSLFGPQDTWNDMQDVIDGNQDCAPVAVIFARGTFDGGNVGVWVGPQWFDSLDGYIYPLHKQGVNENAYKADLPEYLEQGGSEDGANAMAETIKKYHDKCPDTKYIVSGWSQGALVAHKAVNQLSKKVQCQIASVTTFGDPWSHFYSSGPAKAVPKGAYKSYCITGTDFDPLCAKLPQDFKFPTSIGDIVGPFKHLPHVATGIKQIASAAKMVVEFPFELAQSWGAFVQDLNPDQFVRLMLTPQHFEYGNSGMTDTAARDVSNIKSIQAAVAKAKANHN